MLGVLDGQRSKRGALAGVGHLNLDLERVRREIHRGTEPPILVEVQERIEDGIRLALVRVSRGVPPHTTTEGIAKIRVGKECRPLTGSALRQQLLRHADVDLSAQLATGGSIADIDPLQVESLKRALAAGRPDLAALPDQELLQGLGLVRDGQPTVAALLLAGQPAAIARHVPQDEVQIVRFRESETRYDQQRSLKGPLLDVLDVVKGWLDAHLTVTTLAGDGLVETAVPEMSWSAAREPVLNALVHRYWFLHQSVMVEVHPDRIVVTSPGGFPAGVTSENVLRHQPVRRNPLLAEVFQHLGFVNRAGLGVDRIYEELLRLRKGLLRYEADEAQVRLTLRTGTNEAFARLVAREAREGRKLTLDDLIVLCCTADVESLDRRAAARLLQSTEDRAGEVLVALRERGFLRPLSRGTWTSYGLHERHADLARGRAEPGPTMDEAGVRRRLEAELGSRGVLSNADVRRITGGSRSFAIRIMHELRKLGVARLEGKGRSARWVTARGGRAGEDE